MKKTIGLLVVMFGLGASSFAGQHMAKSETTSPLVHMDETEGISFFHGTWAEALASSKKENKLIFLDAYAAWCGPCKTMAKNTFTKKDVGDFFNANFINVKMDMEKDPEGQRLSNKFKLRAYPTLYFINGNEALIHQELGMQKPKQLIQLGEQVLKIK